MKAPQQKWHTQIKERYLLKHSVINTFMLNTVDRDLTWGKPTGDEAGGGAGYHPSTLAVPNAQIILPW